MMDKFKEESFTFLGPGGIKCGCCNPFYRHYGKKHGKLKRKLRRFTRRRLKSKWKIEKGED